jgi:hypothetical protein
MERAFRLKGLSGQFQSKLKTPFMNTTPFRGIIRLVLCLHLQLAVHYYTECSCRPPVSASFCSKCIIQRFDQHLLEHGVHQVADFHHAQPSE